MTKREALEIIKQKIEGCKNTPQNMPDDWRKGFVDGLRQAYRLIKDSRTTT